MVSREKKVDCVFCGKEKHMYINPYKKVYHCFRCGRGGRLTISIMSKIPSLTQIEVKVSEKRSFNFYPLTKEEPFFSYAKRRKALRFRKDLFLSSDFPGYLHKSGYPG